MIAAPWCIRSIPSPEKSSQMPLPSPNLDDRRFQDLVDEAKRMIPTYCPEWTDHNVSDPGVTLIELFAWMVEMMLFRMNKIPEKNYVAFLDLIGLRLQPPVAASVELTFWLAAPQQDPIRIPSGTSVATLPTASESAVEFRTENDMIVIPPMLTTCLTSLDGKTFEDQTPKLRPNDDLFLAFAPTPQPGNAFFVGFSQNLSSHILELTIDCTIEGIGVRPEKPPLAWEAWQNNAWVRLELSRDDTSGLNRAGQVVLFLPPRMTRMELDGKPAFWVRCRVVEPDPEQPPYSRSPRIQAITAATLGGMANASNATPILEEILGRSDGRPGQLFRLEHPPVLPRRSGETIEVLESESGAWEPWTEVEYFSNSSRQDMHFTLDSVSGEICFGPAVRESDGAERQYGAIPPRGSLIRFSHYRRGGGRAGNVGANTITQLLSAVPYIASVTNRRPAEGGLDAETLDAAKLRAPQMLRTSFRAVTAEDYAYLAQEASQRVARAYCLQPRALEQADELPQAVVQVFLIPTVNKPAGYLEPQAFDLSTELIEEVRSYLDDRRLLTTVVRIGKPEYVRVCVQASVKARPKAHVETVRNAIIERLNRFLNPLTGGQDGKGWPFGTDLYISEVYTVLQGTEGIGYIEQVSLFLDGEEDPLARISVPPNGVIASAVHQISVE